jgi:sugar phosphate isomerase/epimerase
MHDRISVNNLCFPGAPLATDLERWRSLGARRIGIQTAKMNAEGWDPYVDQLSRSGFAVETIVHLNPNRWDDDAQVERFERELSRTLAAGKILRARSVYVTSGARGTLTWEETAQKFCRAVAPCAEQARRTGIELLVEPAPALFADLYFTHTLRDAVQLAEQAGVGVVIDVFASWTEAQLRESIERAVKRCHLVQVADYVLGDRGFPCRAVPGDGAIPLERILGWTLEAGYRGAFDLELMGPRIDQEGHCEAVRRTAERLGELLVRLGA